MASLPKAGTLGRGFPGSCPSASPSPPVSGGLVSGGLGGGEALLWGAVCSLMLLRLVVIPFVQHV